MIDWHSWKFHWASSSLICHFQFTISSISCSLKANDWRKKYYFHLECTNTHTHGQPCFVLTMCVCMSVVILWRNVMSRKIEISIEFLLKKRFFSSFFLTSRETIFLLTILLLVYILVCVISNAWQQWQQSADGAEIQLLAYGGRKVGVIWVSTTVAWTDECNGWHPASDACTGARRCLWEHPTQHGPGSSESEKQMVSYNQSKEIEDLLKCHQHFPFSQTSFVLVIILFNLRWTIVYW